MSLINKMLQDLDARGSQAGEGMQGSIKSVVREAPRVNVPLIAGGVAATLVLAAAAWYGWQYAKRPVPPKVAAVPPPASRPAGILPAPASVPAPVSAVVPGPLVAVAAPVEAAAPAEAAPAPVAKAAARVKKAGKAAKAVKAGKAARSAPARAKAKARAVKAAPAAPAAAPAESRAGSGTPKAEGEYRRALASLAEGRVAEGMALLEQAIQTEPRHEAARQTLVGLLIEQKRSDEAQRLLQAGLALDLRQPSMAMLLARLQIERGGSGVETLMKTLPHAGKNPEYHAFLAGALQREGRHKEAGEQYEVALRAAPGNGVWWMGLGMSLQAEKRNAEAIAAYERARDAGNLNAQLQAFVERKLAGLKP